MKAVLITCWSQVGFAYREAEILVPVRRLWTGIWPGWADLAFRVYADVDLEADTDYTVVAVGTLEEIQPVVLVDDNSSPAEGMAHVRFMHASPDAPNVDIFVAGGGPILFENVPFGQAFPYVPVDAGTYDLEVRNHDTDTVVLTVPGVALAEQTVYFLRQKQPATLALVRAVQRDGWSFRSGQLVCGRSVGSIHLAGA